MIARILFMDLRPLDAEAPGRARVGVRVGLRNAGLDDLVDPAELIVSELVTNAHLYSRGNASMVVYQDSGLLFIEVYDASPFDPQRHVADANAEHGRGLEIVSMLAEDWGTDPAVRGKCVWASLAIPAGVKQPATLWPLLEDPPTVILARVAA